MQAGALALTLLDAREGTPKLPDCKTAILRPANHYAKDVPSGPPDIRLSF